MRITLRLTFPLALALSIAGCETIPQQQAHEQQQAQQRLEAALDSAVAKCRSDWEADTRIAPIRGKIPFAFSAASFMQLNDASKPNETEKNAIVALDEIRHACNQSIYALQAQGWPPERSALMQQHLSDARSMLGALWNGSMTYGQYMTESNKQFNAYLYSDERLARGLYEEFRRAQAQEAQARAARMQAMAQYMQATQIKPMTPYIVPQRPIYQTNCNQWAPGQVSCTTR